MTGAELPQLPACPSPSNIRDRECAEALVDLQNQSKIQEWIEQLANDPGLIRHHLLRQSEGHNTDPNDYRHELFVIIKRLRDIKTEYAAHVVTYRERVLIMAGAISTIPRLTRARIHAHDQERDYIEHELRHQTEILIMSLQQVIQRLKEYTATYLLSQPSLHANAWNLYQSILAEQRIIENNTNQQLY